MITRFDFTLTMIKCPSCDTVQAAIVKHTFIFDTYIHDCESCGYCIMESEWEVVKPFILNPTP